MALYELNDSQSKFVKDMITTVTPQGMKREDAKQFIAKGDDVLLQLLRPIHPSGKAKKLTPEPEPPAKEMID